MNQSIAMLAAICCVTFVALGCASKPSALDIFASSSARSNSVAAEVAEQNADFVDTRHSQPTQGQASELEQLERRLQSDAAPVRIAACQQLGRLASQASGDLEPIEMLARVMKTDDSMEVRMAATDALSALNGSEENDHLANMIPSEELPSAPKAQVSLLQRFLR